MVVIELLLLSFVLPLIANTKNLNFEDTYFNLNLIFVVDRFASFLFFFSEFDKRSNTNIQRKLSKQNIAETNNNTSFAQNLLINRQNKRYHNKQRSAASATSNADD